MNLIGSILYTVLLFLSVLVGAVAVVLLGLISREAAWRVPPAWAWVNFQGLRWLCGLRYRVEGREHIPRRDAVLFWKHQSTWETIAQFGLLPPLACVLKRELMFVPILGWALARLRQIPIDRGSGGRAVRQVVREGRKRLDEGMLVVIFPEGTRMAPGKTRRYGVSGAALARESGRPVVPVAHNAGDYWPRRGLRKKRGTVHVVFGPPIDSKGRSAAEINDLAQQWIESTMARISDAYRAPRAPADGDGAHISRRDTGPAGEPDGERHAAHRGASRDGSANGTGRRMA
jgi:1-acyl-sn-glycerol-3-phosphate acyltransferase